MDALLGVGGAVVRYLRISAPPVALDVSVLLSPPEALAANDTLLAQTVLSPLEGHVTSVSYLGRPPCLASQGPQRDAVSVCR